MLLGDFFNMEANVSIVILVVLGIQAIIGFGFIVTAIGELSHGWQSAKYIFMLVLGLINYGIGSYTIAFQRLTSLSFINAMFFVILR